MDAKEVTGSTENQYILSRNSVSKWRNLTGFWILGLCNNYGYVIILSAAHDILASRFGDGDQEKAVEHASKNSTIDSRECNELSTGAILLANIIPSLLIKLTAPFMPFYMHVRMVICIATSFGGFLAVALGTTKWLTIVGVIITSISSGLGEVSILGYLHKFDRNNITAWSSGTGGAGIIGAISYAGMRIIMEIETAMLIMLIVPITEAIAFWFIVDHPVEQPIVKYGINSQEEFITEPKKTFLEKILLVPGLLIYTLPLGFVYLFEYFINMGLYELIQYDNIWLSHEEQYRWLQADYQIGVFISRSSASIITFHRTWLMAVFQFINVLLFTSEAIFFYIPSIWIVFALTFWEGLLGGGSYVNTFHRMANEIPSRDLRDSLAIATMADSIGITISGWIAMAAHSAICKLPRPIR